MRPAGFLNTARTFLDAEAENVRRFDISWRHRLWLYSNGFLSSKDAIWELTDDTVDQYLSDLEYRNLRDINEPYNSGLNNKWLFRQILTPTHEHLLPDVYGLFRDGQFAETNRTDGLQSFDHLLDLLTDEPVVMKPVTAAKGDGVHVLDSRAGRVRIDGTPVSRAQLLESVAEGGDTIVEELVSQAEYAETVFPESTNTMRLLTMIDPETGELFVATATHRFGTTSSGHTDNWSAGGLSARIDLDTGTLGPAVTNPKIRSNTDGRTERHPDTGAQIAGTEIPAWEQIVDTVRNLAAEYSAMWPHVGWDVVVRDDQGSVTVLEGEPRSVDADQQAHGPLLSDERVRRFYEHHGVLSDSSRSFSL